MADTKRANDSAAALPIATTAARRSVFDAGHGFQDTSNAAGATRFAMSLAAPAERWSLRCRAVSSTRPDSVAGFGIDQPINKLLASKTDAGSTLISARLGPDEWLLIAEAHSPTDNQSTMQSSAAAEVTEAHNALAEALAGRSHSLVDISHRQVAIVVAGTAAADVLNTGCPLPLDGNAFPIGTATRTIFAKVEIVLMRLPDDQGRPAYRVECWRSFARYLAEHLQDSARLLGVAPTSTR